MEAESKQNSRAQNLIDNLYDDREVALYQVLGFQEWFSLQNPIIYELPPQVAG